MKDKTDSNRAFANLQMIKDTVETIWSDRFVVVQRYNIVTAGMLSRDELTNRRGRVDRCKDRQTAGEAEIKF